MPTVRDAASLILLKQEEEGLRVLMGLRHAGHKFMPNRMVFPGGGVDQDDAAAPVATPLRAHVLERLERAASPELARGLGHAVARELEEETGLTLGNPPALGGLDYLCRAVTPAERPIRFNARFFVGDASLVSGTIAGSGELEALAWYEVQEVLKLDLALATRVVLEQLQIWLKLDEAERASRQVPVLQDRGWGVE
jgi:8-oxo-dGTP pyrophosphatase MutT (NUDIX family)